MMLFPKIEVFILQDNSIPIFMFTMVHKCLLQKENVPFKMHLSCHHRNINHKKGTPNGFLKRQESESRGICEEFCLLSM